MGGTNSATFPVLHCKSYQRVHWTLLVFIGFFLSFNVRETCCRLELESRTSCQEIKYDFSFYVCAASLTWRFVFVGTLNVDLYFVEEGASPSQVKGRPTLCPV